MKQSLSRLLIALIYKMYRFSVRNDIFDYNGTYSGNAEILHIRVQTMSFFVIIIDKASPSWENNECRLSFPHLSAQ